MKEMKKIIEKLLEAYKQAIIDLPLDSKAKAMEYLKGKNMQHGVCHNAEICFGEDIYNSRWVQNNIKEDDYWCTPPYFCNNVEEIKKSIETRIKILESCLI